MFHSKKASKTVDAGAPAGTFSRAILNRLMIDLSWASSQLEGNTYSRLDTRTQIDTAHDNLLSKAERIRDPFEQSFFMMVHLPYLQPFADMNKRTSRLAANLPLTRANLCPLTFLDVPASAYSQGVLGVYELTRVDLLRDVNVWAYERSAQEYLAIKQELAEPDPLRLRYREIIKAAVREIVTTGAKREVAILERATQPIKPKRERDLVQTIITDELARLHEGVLAHYGLRPSEFVVWKKRRGL